MCIVIQVARSMFKSNHKHDRHGQWDECAHDVHVQACLYVFCHAVPRIGDAPVFQLFMRISNPFFVFCWRYEEIEPAMDRRDWVCCELSNDV